MLAPRVTAKRKGRGLTPTSMAALMAIGAISTAVAVLLMNIVSREVVKYMPQSNAMGPTQPKSDTSEWLTSADVPVFSSAVAMGIMAAISTTLSRCHGHHDGHHQGHRTRIAYEGSDDSRDEYHKHEEGDVVAAGK